MKYKYSGTRGFTLVELMLAMTFLSILLVMIATLTLQISTIYNKGLTLRGVNEAGQLLSSEIQRKLNTAHPSTVQNIEILSGGTPVAGRLCIGTDVYAWNYSDYVGYTGSITVNKYSHPADSGLSASEKTNIRFIKFAGAVGEYCEDTNPDPPVAYLPLPEKANVTELLERGDADLVLRDFSLSQHSVLGDGTQQIYRVTYALGTRTADLIDSNDTCVPPTGAGDEYCAVNEFSFTARAGGSDD